MSCRPGRSPQIPERCRAVVRHKCPRSRDSEAAQAGNLSPFNAAHRDVLEIPSDICPSRLTEHHPVPQPRRQYAEQQCQVRSPSVVDFAVCDRLQGNTSFESTRATIPRARCLQGHRCWKCESSITLNGSRPRFEPAWWIHRHGPDKTSCSPSCGVGVARMWAAEAVKAISSTHP